METKMTRRILMSVFLLLACVQLLESPDASAKGPLPAPGAFPHDAWTAILQKYVNAAGLVDYKGIQQDRTGIDAYTALLAQVSPESNPEIFPSSDDKLAYWINAYNANAITGVINRPGLTSVNENSVTLAKFFYTTKYKYGGKKYSLYAVENSIVRPQFQDPRVHFALNCDSGGCPRLPQEAFNSSTLQAQLEAATLEFVTNPAKVRVEGEGADTKVMISQIFEWYADDFKAAGGAVAFINAHGGSVPLNAPVVFIPYDWSLIAQEGRGP
jgi:hypothetical protein